MLKYSKVRILFLVLFCLLANGSFAQKRASLGLKFGSGFSGYYFVTDININPDPIKVGFIPVYSGGVVFNYLDKIVGIQIGTQYIQKGWIETFNNNATSEVVIDYLEVPILTHIRFGRTKKSGWVVNLGIYGAYVIQTNENHSELKPDLTQDTEYIKYYEMKYSAFDYGIKAGGGFEFGLGKNSLQFELMFTQGMQNFFEQDRVGIYKSLSQTLTFSAIYKFTLFRRGE